VTGLTIHEEKLDGAAVYRLQGRVHGGTADHLEERLLDAIDGGERRFAVDCAGLDYISSAGVRVLSVVGGRLQTLGGQLVLFAVEENVQDILNITGLATVFPSFPTEADALRRLSAGELPRDPGQD
jgi:anti-anti-sigma factor